MAQSNPIVRGPWPLGINNRANEKSVPEGSVRDSVNLDPRADGAYELRRGFELAYAGANIRGALAIGDRILLADGSKLIVYDESTESGQQIADIAAAGRFVGDVLNGELFFCTENQSLRYKEGVLRPWGVPTVSYQPVPAVGQGSLAAGSYLCAATFVDANGEEGGTTAQILIDVPANSSLTFTLPQAPAGGTCRLYVSALNSATLYLQYEGTGPYDCASITDSSARLDTAFLHDPGQGDIIAAHNGVLLIADGNVLHMTAPMRPHLRSAVRGFFQFAAPIAMVMSCDGGVYVAADKTYFIQGIETDEPISTKVFDFGAVPGSATRGLKREVMWMTKYGIAVSDGQGGATLISEDRFAPALGDSGKTAIVENNGNQMAVTTLKNPQGPNPLAAGDYYETEIYTP